MKSLHISLLVAVLSAGCAHRASDYPVSLLGHPIPSAAAEKTIVLNPDTRWVNVNGGEAVRFVSGGREFGWAFNVAATVSSFDLSRVAPPGVLPHPVIAYVGPDPRYIGGDGGERND
ncbi:CzcE family metal-binding protein [Noviherbaspirillum aridicola]|uniref:Heavy-metal resistance protein CzcE n=1 Tax=Noviherbaspirillum aridicola TaxID=2849687 RepID=A0ABQ4Q9V8_9BURK|nr:CzcE family metal-binding protein [Noviherbaspirillum aridicola]GIZ54012.1 hypothetical protein NCCP691_40260 [Noviherbaspirillum aridicola]